MRIQTEAAPTVKNGESRLVKTVRPLGGIFTVSFAMLFLELTLIRWLSTEVRIFSYFHNLVLLACFLGIGTGCALARSKVRFWAAPASLFLILAAVILPLHATIRNYTFHIFRDSPTLLSAFEDTLIWGEVNSTHMLLKIALGLSSVTVLFLLVMALFVPLGQTLGRLMALQRDGLPAYSVSVSASLLGICAFKALT